RRRGVGGASQRSDQSVWTGESGAPRRVSAYRPACYLWRLDGDRLLSARRDRSSGTRHVRVDDAWVRKDDVPCASEADGPRRGAAAADETTRYSGEGGVDVWARGRGRSGLQRHL